MPRRYWLVKSEPGTFSIQDLARAPKQTTTWDGVRNYQARNILRDEMQVGDGVLFYHSSADPPAVAGTAEIARAGYPDPTELDPKSNHYDPAAKASEPRWYMVDIKLASVFASPVTLPALREIAALRDMVLLRKGSRLSVQPVSPQEWKIIVGLGTAR
jgi:predicted RNA-binding protein with PUA-like domain